MTTTEQYLAPGEDYQFRFPLAKDLYDTIPEIRDDLTARAGKEETLDYIRKLLGSPIAEEAITFCAYLLPKREAVWWAFQCLKTLPEALGEHDHHMLELAENWVRNPGEDSRYRVLSPAMDAEQKTPGTWVALAAGWSGGSMLEPSQPAVEPPAYLTPRAINAAILSSLAWVHAQHRQEAIEQFVSYALKLSQRRPDQG